MNWVTDHDGERLRTPLEMESLANSLRIALDEWMANWPNPSKILKHRNCTPEDHASGSHADLFLTYQSWDRAHIQCLGCGTSKWSDGTDAMFRGEHVGCAARDWVETIGQAHGQWNAIETTTSWLGKPNGTLLFRQKVEHLRKLRREVDDAMSPRQFTSSVSINASEMRDRPTGISQGIDRIMRRNMSARQIRQTEIACGFPAGVLDGLVCP